MAAKTRPCPRCDGTGIYAGYGVCYRCHGTKVVKATKAAKAAKAIVETDEAKEARLRAAMGDVDYEIIHGKGGYYDR